MSWENLKEEIAAEFEGLGMLDPKTPISILIRSVPKPRKPYKKRKLKPRVVVTPPEKPIKAVVRKKLIQRVPRLTQWLTRRRTNGRKKLYHSPVSSNG